MHFISSCFARLLCLPFRDGLYLFVYLYIYSLSNIYFASHLQQGTDVNVAIEGRPPLCLASDYGQLEIIKYLLDKGANVEVRLTYLLLLLFLLLLLPFLSLPTFLSSHDSFFPLPIPLCVPLLHLLYLRLLFRLLLLLLLT